MSCVKHFLTGEEFSRDMICSLLDLGEQLRSERSKKVKRQTLSGKTLALLFEKPSLRTKFSFSVAMYELGGMVVESLSSSRKHESPEDVARVLSSYCHGVVLRTHEQNNLDRMAARSSIPI